MTSTTTPARTRWSAFGLAALLGMGLAAPALAQTGGELSEAVLVLRAWRGEGTINAARITAAEPPFPEDEEEDADAR